MNKQMHINKTALSNMNTLEVVGDIEIKVGTVATSKNNFEVVIAPVAPNGELHCPPVVFEPIELKAVEQLCNVKGLHDQNKVGKLAKKVMDMCHAFTEFMKAQNMGWQYNSSSKRVAYAGESFIVKSDGENANLLDAKYFDGREKQLDLQLAALCTWLKGNVKRQIILLAALAAPICELLRGNTHQGSIILGLVGRSSSGKSTAAIIDASIFSDYNDVTKKFNSTELAMLEFLNENAGVPVVFDDTSLRKWDMSNMVYALAEGSSRDRVVKKRGAYTTTPSSHWTTSIIMTGERSIYKECNTPNLGIVPRLLELPVEGKELFDSKEQCDELKTLMTSYPGVIGEKFIKELMRLGFDKVQSMFNDEKERIGSVDTKKDAILGRIGTTHATLLVTAMIANQLFGNIFNWENLRVALADIAKQNLRTFNQRTPAGAAQWAHETIWGRIESEKDDEENKGLITIKDGKGYISSKTGILKEILKDISEETVMTPKDIKEAMVDAGYVETVRGLIIGNHTVNGKSFYGVVLKAPKEENHD